MSATDLPRHDPLLEGQADRGMPLLRRATLSDASRLHEIADTVSLDRLRKEKADTDRTGFLVSGYTKEEYADWTQKADHFLVLQVEGEVRAFVLAYRSELIDRKKEELNTHILDKLSKSFILLKQVCCHPRYSNNGYGERLYRELFARVIHEDSALQRPTRPVFAAIVESPANPRSLSFHRKLGFTQADTFMPSDGTPRLIFANTAVDATLRRMCSVGTASPKMECTYDAVAQMDHDCVGVGVVLYRIAPPDEKGAFMTEVRIMLKWRHPPVMKLHPRDPDAARTTVDLDGPLRIPRYASNTIDVDTVQRYAYIDRGDPPDVVTMQLVLRGTYSCTLELRNFPADIQCLPYRFRMWDSVCVPSPRGAARPRAAAQRTRAPPPQAGRSPALLPPAPLCRWHSVAGRRQGQDRLRRERLPSPDRRRGHRPHGDHVLPRGSFLVRHRVSLRHPPASGRGESVHGRLTRPPRARPRPGASAARSTTFERVRADKALRLRSRREPPPHARLFAQLPSP